MKPDWLWGIPYDSWEAQKAWVSERLAADPVIAGFSDDEAESFFVVGQLVRHLSVKRALQYFQAFGVRVSGRGEKSRRLGTTRLMRKWKDPRVRYHLMKWIPHIKVSHLPAVIDRPDAWTEEAFQEAYENGADIVSLVTIRRYLDRADNLSEWIASLGETAETDYRFWVDVARIGLRRLAYPPAPPFTQVAAAEQAPVTEADLRQKERLTGSLRHDVRRLERDRKDLRRRTRLAEQQVKAMLSQARGEVEAGRRALRKLLGAQEQELAAQARRFEQDLKLVRDRIVTARKKFLQVLTDSTLQHRWNLLEGRSIAVTDCLGYEEPCRALVESLGGVWLAEGGEVTISARGGLSSVERELRSLALQRVLIKCDGLYRRRDGRHGIAVAGFQVHAGQVVIHQDGRVVNCGPLAGSLMAEYGAVLLALNWLLSVCPPPGAQLVIWSDCRSLLGRLRRAQGVKRKRGCVSLDSAVRRAVRLLRKKGCEVVLRWVPRDEVEAVDRLCDSTYRSLGWYRRRGSKPRAPLKEFLSAAGPARVS